MDNSDQMVEISRGFVRKQLLCQDLTLLGNDDGTSGKPCLLKLVLYLPDYANA